MLDVTNPLDFAGGMPPKLSVVNDDSLGEQLQRQFPEAHIVKSLNTVTASLFGTLGTATFSIKVVR